MTFKDYIITEERKRGVVTNEIIQDIKRTYSDPNVKHPLKELMKRHNLSKGAIQNQLDKYDIKTRHAHQVITPEKRENILNELKAGGSPKAIATKYNVSLTSVARLKRTSGIPRKIYRVLSDELKQNIVKDAKAGMTNKELSLKYNVSSANITSIFRKFNVPTLVRNPLSTEQIQQLDSLARKMDDKKEHYLYSLRAISKQLNRPEMTVYTTLKQLKTPEGLSLAKDRTIKGIYNSNNAVFKRYSSTPTSERDKKMIDAYVNKKMTISEIGRMFNLTPERVIFYLKKWGVHKKSKKTIPKETINQIVADLKSGQLSKDIAKKYGVSTPTITDIKVKYGIPFKYKDLPEDVVQRLIKLGKIMDPSGKHYKFGTKIIGIATDINRISIRKLFKKIKLANGKTLAQDRIDKGVINISHFGQKNK